MKRRTRRFWISWYEHADDYRPRTWPLPEAVPAYWCSGEAPGAFTVCAIVDAPTEDAAQEIIGAHWNPGPLQLRFCQEVDQGWRPPGDRFPWPAWAEGRS